MTRTALALAAAALLALSACESTGDSAANDSIQWNAPAQPPAAVPQARECREYRTTVNIAGKAETAIGRACRQPDGSWKEEGLRTGGLPPATPAEQGFPYGWHGYDYPHGPLYGPGGLSVGVGAGTGGGWVGYGVGF